MTESRSPDAASTAPPPRRHRRWGRRLMLAGAFILTAMVVLVALAPKLAGSLGRGPAERAINGRITGSVELGKVSLAWFSGQRVGPVIVRDDRGQQIASIELSLARGLAGLAGGSMDLGVATVKGRADIERYADGSTNLQKALAPKAGAAAPPPPPSTGASAPPAIPTGLAAELVLDNLEVTLTDPALAAGLDPSSGAGRAAVKNISGRAVLRPGQPATFNLSAKAVAGPAEAPAGSLDIKASAAELFDASGVLTTDRANLDASIEATGVSVALIDALAGQRGKLIAALGQSAGLTVTARGTMSDLTATLAASADTASADVELRYAGGRAVLPRPAVLKARTDGLVALAPALADSLSRNQSFSIGAYPSAEISIDRLDLPIPTSGGLPDLRGASLRATFRAGEAAARLTLPGGARDYRVAPVAATIDAPDLAGPVTIRATTSSSIDGRRAGELVVDLTAAGLLDGAGRPRAGGPGSVEGTVALQGFETEIAQPFLDAAGLRLSDAVGPTLDVEITAVQRASGTGGLAAGETMVEAGVASKNINAGLTALKRGTVLRPSAEVTIASLAPVVAPFIARSGATIDPKGGLTAVVRDASVDLARLGGSPPAAPSAGTPSASPADATPDLRGSGLFVDLSIEALRGTAPAKGPAAPRPWSLAATKAFVDARDLTRPATFGLDTSATFSGRPAGAISLRGDATGLVDASGAPASRPEAMSAELSLTGVATELVQMFVPAGTLDLPADVGPTIDVKASVAARPREPGAGPAPATDVAFSIHAENVDGSGSVALSGGSLHSKDSPITLSLRNAGGAAARFVPASTGLAMAPSGDVSITVSDVSVPLVAGASGGVAPRLDRAGVRVAAEARGLAVTPARAGAGPPLAIDSVRIGAGLAPGAPPTVSIASAMRHGGEPASISADLSIPGLLAFGPSGELVVSPGKAAPRGSIAIDAPASLAALAPRPAGSPAKDLAAVVRSAMGPRAAVRVDLKAGATDAATQADFSVASERVTAGGSAALLPDRFELKGLQAKADLTPAGVDGLVAALAPPDLSARPRLAGPTTATLTVGYLGVPRTEAGGADLAAASNTQVTLTLPGAVVVDQLLIAQKDGSERNAGPLGVSGLKASAAVPVAALAGGASAKPGRTEATIAATLHGASGAATGSLDATLGTWLTGSRPGGATTAKLKLTNASTAWIDALSGMPGMISGALGQQLTIDASIDGQLDAPATAGAPPRLRSGTAVLGVASPRLTLAEPVRVAVEPDRVRLLNSARAPWTIDHRWVNQQFLRPQVAAVAAAGAAGVEAPRPIQVAEPVTLNLNLNGLTVARGPAPLKPGVFALQLLASSPGVKLTLPDGSTASLADLSMESGHTTDSPGVGLAVSLRDASQAKAADPMKLAIVAYGIADAAGVPTPDRSVVNATLTAPAISTALLDALAMQRGLLAEALGPSVSAQATLQGVSKTSGHVSATAQSPKAKAAVSGAIGQDRVFRADAPLTFSLAELSPRVSAVLFRGLPSIATLEKRPEDGPADLRISGLTLPLDGDMSKLNAMVNFEPGTARFTASAGFGQLLKLSSQRTEGQVGRRLDPLTIEVKDGVATYPRYTLPVGEFRLDTRGSVDLVNRRMDVITYLPFGALTDEASGAFNLGLGGALGRAVPLLEATTMVPWRTSGPFDNPSSGPDFQLFIREFGEQMLRPDRLLEEGLKDLLGGGG